MLSKADKKILQAVLVGAAVIIIGLVYYTMAFVNAEITGKDADIKANDALLKKHQDELTELKAWAGRSNEINAIINELLQKVQRLPRSVEASDFFRILRDCVHRTNLSEIKVAKLKSINMGAYEEIPYMITCRARYHDLGQFLTLVEQNAQQIMRVKTLDLFSDLKRPSRHRVSLQVATFVFTEPLPKPRGREAATP